MCLSWTTGILELFAGEKSGRGPPPKYHVYGHGVLASNGQKGNATAKLLIAAARRADNATVRTDRSGGFPPSYYSKIYPQSIGARAAGAPPRRQQNSTQSAGDNDDEGEGEGEGEGDDVTNALAMIGHGLPGMDDTGRVRSQITNVVCQIHRFDFDCNLVVTRKLIIRIPPGLCLNPL
jgi:hypothetical protein